VTLYVYPSCGRLTQAWGKSRDQSGRTVESGCVLAPKIQQEDLDKVETVIEAQWKLLQVAALSGAGEAPDELDSTYRLPPERALLLGL
jgi:hypothetical protein